MESHLGGDRIKSEAAALNLISQVSFSGVTPLGTSLQHKVLEPFVLGPARMGTLRKPIPIITTTDGAPAIRRLTDPSSTVIHPLIPSSPPQAGEDHSTLSNAIRAANQELSRTRFGPDAVSYQLAAVGNDQGARRFWEEIDVGEVGRLVDVSSSFLWFSSKTRRAED
jgi:hypothetical protein